MYKTGIGYDAHRLVKGRKLFLGGVEIKHDKGLEGHSDADALLHAICDAVLGALGKGDIGEHFPNTDPKYRGISSLKLLEAVSRIAADANYAVVNVDAVLLAQAPKINSYKPLMKARIAKALRIAEDHVNIKATTTEGLGAIGRGEGISAYATVLIRKLSSRKTG